MDIKEYIVKAMVEADAARPRSNQYDIGPSEIGGCRARVWLRSVDGTPVVNQTSKWAATLGTAIHSHIEEALRRQDPFGEEFLIEQEVAAEGLRGHVDLYMKQTRTVVDWKTTTTKSLGYFPSQQQRWQVHLYGYLMNHNGFPVETVALVAIPRDGSEDDIVVHAEPYDPAVAQEALDWWKKVEASPLRPAPEKDAVSWCSRFCEYYGVCEGRSFDKAAPDRIVDPEAIEMARRFNELNTQIKALEEEQKMLRAGLEGFEGITPDNVTVAWSEVAGRSTTDEDAVKAALGYVPKKTGKPSMRLVVKQA